MNPSMNPIWRVVIQRFARATDAWPMPAAGRQDLVEQRPLEPADERGEARRVGPHPAGPVDDPGPPDDARQLRPERLAQARDDPGHRLGVGGLGRRELRLREGPGGVPEPSDRDPLRRRPVDEALARRTLHPPGGDRGRHAERRADEEARLPDALVAPGPGRAAALGHATATWRSTVATSAKPGPNSRSARTWNASASPVVSWRWIASAPRRGRGIEPVHREEVDQGGRGGRRRVDHRDAVAGHRLDHRPEQRVVGAAQEERVDPGRRREREDELAARVALAEERRERFAHGGLDLGPGEEARLDHRHERRGGVLVDLDGRVLLLDRLEVGVRADGGRGRDHADPPDPGRQGGRGGAGPDHAEDRQRVAPAQVGQGDRGRRVAGDDHGLDVALDEPVEGLPGEREDLVVGPRAVRRAGVVAEVDRRFAGQPADDLAQDRQSADPGVEHADGSRVRHVSSGRRRPVDRAP